MLEVARKLASPNATFASADMLAFVQQTSPQTADLIISTWALGYSDYRKLFPACLRVLRHGGVLAFIVNYADTLRPVFSAFEQCMLRFPERVKLAAWPRFPKKWAGLEMALQDSGFTILYHRDGKEKIELPQTGIAKWLRGTGILAGFDQMMDLTGTAGEFLEQEISRAADQVFHHYAMVIAGKSGGPV
jgi:trans-aconitate methyltransferase